MRMIQPLSKNRPEWVVRWVEVDEAVVSVEGEVILPVFQIVTDGRGVPLDAPDMVAELEQGRLEETLEKLFEEHGKPGRLVVASSEDWDEEEWKEFCSQHDIALRFRDLRDETVCRFQDLRDAVGGGGKGREEEARLAFFLKEKSMELRSARRREAYLRKALDFNPSFSAARIDLADIEFSRGEWKKCMASYESVLETERLLAGAQGVSWWTDHSTRSYLRALFGRAMTFWHQGKYRDATQSLQRLLKINAEDHQGVRFYIPMLLLLEEREEEAWEYFEKYAVRYPGDFVDPAMYFGWGLLLSFRGEEAEALKKYQAGMLKNIYMAPLLLEERVPARNLWQPNDRSEPVYAEEFVDSYAPLWDKEPGSLRMLREAWDGLVPRIREIVAHRQAVLDFQDQRYDKDFRAKWERMIEKDNRLSTDLGKGEGEEL